MTDAPLEQRHVVVCAGISGGVGTTTVAALLANIIASRTGHPNRILDHTGGNIAERISANSETSASVIHDLGPHALSIHTLLTDPAVFPVICLSPNSTLGPNAPPVDRPYTVVVNSSNRRLLAAPLARRLRLELPDVMVVSLEWDPGLSVPRPINIASLTHHTITEASQLLSFLYSN
jgi:hypothetical protein